MRLSNLTQIKWAEAVSRALRQSLVAKALGAVGLAIIAFAVLVVVIVHAMSASAEEAQKQLLTYTAHSIAHAVDTELQRYLTIATMLAASEHLRNDDLSAFAAQTSAQLQGLNVDVILVEGRRQIYNSGFPGVALAPRSDEGYRSALIAEERDQATVSNVYQRAMRVEYIATVEIPKSHVTGGRYGMAIVFSLEPFRQLLSAAPLEPQWIVGIADGAGRDVARLPNGSPGATISTGWRATLRKPGIAEFMSREGVMVVNANALPKLADWTVGISISRAALDTAARRSLRWVIIAGSSIVMLLATVMVLFGYRMRHALAAFQSSVVARLNGERAPFVAPPQELAALWTAVEKSADLRDKREFMLEESLQNERAARDELHRSSRILKSISDLSSDLIYAKDRERNLVFVSASVARLLQQSVENLLGKNEQFFLISPEEQERICKHDERVLGGENITEEEPTTTPSGDRRVFLSNKLPWRDEAGRIIGILGISVDITERRANEERMLFVMREVSHRAKNLLAVVQAIAHSSSRYAASTDDFLRQFNARLQAVARSLDLLVMNEWRGIDLEALVRTQLDHLNNLIDRRIYIEGEPVKLTATAGQTIGMALHELATNAVKYGALSQDAGRVHIKWRCEAGQFCMAWREEDGPLVKAPQRKGFGTNVLSNLLRANFTCAPELRYDASGFCWSVSCPIGEIGAPYSPPDQDFDVHAEHQGKLEIQAAMPSR